MPTQNSRSVLIAVIIGFFIVALGGILFVFAPFSGPPDASLKAETGSIGGLPVAAWWLGAFILAGAIAYGMLRNRTRTPQEKAVTEAATKRNYADEANDEGVAPDLGRKNKMP